VRVVAPGWGRGAGGATTRMGRGRREISLEEPRGRRRPKQRPNLPTCSFPLGLPDVSCWSSPAQVGHLHAGALGEVKSI